MMKNIDRQNSLIEGKTTYKGTPCKYGHGNIRYTISKACVGCSKSRSKTTASMQRSRDWYKRNPEKAAANSKFYWIRTKYNLSKEDYLKLRALHKACPICNTDLTIRKESDIHIDHCHKTGKVRSLLCNNCNVGLGNFKDNCTLLLNAISYLESHK